jgi:hypothetical protein
MSACCFTRSAKEPASAILSLSPRYFRTQLGRAN